jgi:hypothetical protein
MSLNFPLIILYEFLTYEFLIKFLEYIVMKLKLLTYVTLIWNIALDGLFSSWGKCVKDFVGDLKGTNDEVF